ncbi:alpha-galactosidase [Myxococcota bacterium]|nr:alpha-galactosidase [Myxococcota bacterium]
MSAFSHGTLRFHQDGIAHSLDLIVGKPTTYNDIQVEWILSPHPHGSQLRMSLDCPQPVVIESLTLETAFTFDPQEHILINAFQSWSSAGEYRLHDTRSPLHVGEDATDWYELLKNYGDYSFFNYDTRPGHFHSYTYLMFRKGTRTPQLFGSIDEDQGYTIFTTHPSTGHLRVQKDWQGLHLVGQTTPFALWFGQGDEQALFTDYTAAFRHKSPDYPPLSGWTSWYHYYTDISEATILQNLHTFQEQQIPTDIFQIDDGYQWAIGDWLRTLPDRFPNGMKPIAEAIHQAGYKAGLWLAPFICEQKSSLPQEHPSWILRDEHGNPRVVGNNPFYWSGEFYALDIYHPEVQAYLQQVFATILEDWGFDMVKLDFLYGAALWPPSHKSRGMVMSDGMALLRRWCKDRLILGCGVPLGAAWGRVDFCRIGSDVGLGWEDEYLSQILYQERVSTVNSLNSTLARRHLNHRAFLNDPDVYFLRDQNLSMNDHQKHSLFLANQIFGSLLFTSDPIGEYNDAQRALYLSQFPVLPKTLEDFFWDGPLRLATFRIQDLRYTVAMNLHAQPSTIAISPGLYYERNLGWLDLRDHTTLSLAPHQSRCLLHVSTEPWTLIGGDAHLFPCSEVSALSIQQHNLTLLLHPHTRRQGTLFLSVPPDSPPLHVDRQTYTPQHAHGLSFLAIPTSRLFGLHTPSPHP